MFGKRSMGNKSLSRNIYVHQSADAFIDCQMSDTGMDSPLCSWQNIKRLNCPMSRGCEMFLLVCPYGCLPFWLTCSTLPLCLCTHLFPTPTLNLLHCLPRPLHLNCPTLGSPICWTRIWPSLGPNRRYCLSSLFAVCCMSPLLGVLCGPIYHCACDLLLEKQR